MKKHKIFESNPNLKEVHMTSDGESFYNENDAKLHAKTLKDKNVELVVNPSQLEVITEELDPEHIEEFNKEKTGEALKGSLTEVTAKPDGSVNVLDTTKSSEKIETSKGNTQKNAVIKKDKSKAEVTAKVETPKEETPQDETPTEELPKEETPKEETPKEETPKEETPKEEVQNETSNNPE